MGEGEAEVVVEGAVDRWYGTVKSFMKEWNR